MEAQRVRHDVRNDDVPFHLVDEEEEDPDPEDAPRRVREERVDQRRHGGEPRPDVRDHLDERSPEAEQERVLLGALDEAGDAEDVHAHARARPDDGREDRLTFQVSPQRPLDPLGQRCAPVRWEARVDRALQSLHVEEHVDRDDDDQDEREHQEHERERGSLGERDRILRVAGDLAGARARPATR